MNKVKITDEMLAKLSPSERINWLIAELNGWSIGEDEGELLLYHNGAEYGTLRSTGTADEVLEVACNSRWYGETQYYTRDLEKAIQLMDDSMSLYKLHPRQGKGLYACGLFTEDSEWIGHIVSNFPALAICGMFGYANEVDFMPLIRQIDSEAYEEGLE